MYEFPNHPVYPVRPAVFDDRSLMRSRWRSLWPAASTAAVFAIIGAACLKGVIW